MKHTGGDWRIGGSPEHPHIYSKYGVIAIIEPNIWNYDESRRGEVQANAYLVASAPELLEALLAIDEGFRDGSIQFTKKRRSDSDPYHKANVLMTAALRKAEGKESA